MNAKDSFSLTDYQLGMLTSMGISSWTLQTQSDAPVADSQQETQIEKSIPEAISRFKKTSPVAKKEVKAIPGQLLLLMPPEQAEESLVADILLAACFLPTHTRTIVDQDITEFSNFDFAWQFGHEVELSGSVLTTPPLDKMLQPELKQQLWKIMSAHATQ